jgi:pSer/pThr/pTyr-binding forkhead associated (FHA) protein
MKLEDELNIPSEAYLPEISLFTLKICNSSSIEISRSNSIRLSSNQNTTSSASIRCLIVGRQAATSDIRIQHGSISRKHAAFFFMRKGELFLIAFGGKHGTFVNGLPIQGSVPLKHGDTIVFGNARESVFTVNEVPKQTSSPRKTSLHDKEEIDNQKQQCNDLKLDDKAKDNEEPQLKGNATPITRKDREAEIAAMVASLDEAPEYQKYVRNEDIEDNNALHANGNLATSVPSQYGLPITQQFHIEASSEPTLSSTTKCVKQTLTTMILDKSGSRLAVGHGQHLKIYDFSGMDRKRTAPFKTILVEDGYIVEHACYSNTGDRILVATSSPQPTVLDRDGNEM